MSVVVTDQNRAQMWQHLAKSADPGDSVTYPQLLGAARMRRLPNNQYGVAAAQLLGVTPEVFKTQFYRRPNIRNLKIVAEIPPEALAVFDRDPGEAPEVETGVAPPAVAPGLRGGPLTQEVLATQLGAARPPLVPMGRLPRMEDFDTKTASTSLTAGARLESVRRQMGAPASSADEKIARLEATQEELLKAVEKINETLRKYRDTFNSHVDILDVTQEAVAVLQHNVGVLHHDITGLYGQ